MHTITDCRFAVAITPISPAGIRAGRLAVDIKTIGPTARCIGLRLCASNQETFQQGGESPNAPAPSRGATTPPFADPVFSPAPIRSGNKVIPDFDLIEQVPWA